MKNKLMVVFALFLGMISPSATVFAQPPGAMEEGHGMTFIPPDKEFIEDSSLHLSKEQKEKIKKIFEENKPEMKKSGKELWEKMKNFRKVYVDDKKTDEDVIKVSSEVEGAHKRVSEQHFKLMLQIRSVLTSEQRKQFFENRKGHKNKKRNKSDE